MNRRALLASLGAAAAAPATGCLAASGGPGTTARTDAPTGYRIADFAVDAAKVAPTRRYYLRVVRSYSADGVERDFANSTVLDVSAIEDDAVRGAVKRVLREERVWTDRIPDGLRALVERVDFFTWDARSGGSDAYTHWGLAVYEARPDRDPVVEFGARVRDAGVSAADPGAIEFSLTNAGERTYRVFSGTVPPFGLLWARRPDGGEDAPRFLLWRDYAEEGCVTVRDDGRVAVCAIGRLTPIEPGETISRTYRVRPDAPTADALAAGDWTVAGTLTYHPGRESLGPSTEVEWEVDFALERP